VVLGEPAPQGSKRHVGRGVMIEASTKIKPWREAIKAAVHKETAKDWSMFMDPVIVTAIFYLPRPRTVSRDLPSVAPDLDKLCRGLGDGLSIDAGIIADDSLIVQWNAIKVYADDHMIGAWVRIDTIKDTKKFAAEVDFSVGKM